MNDLFRLVLTVQVPHSMTGKKLQRIRKLIYLKDQVFAVSRVRVRLAAMQADGFLAGEL